LQDFVFNDKVYKTAIVLNGSSWRL